MKKQQGRAGSRRLLAACLALALVLGPTVPEGALAGLPAAATVYGAEANRSVTGGSGTETAVPTVQLSAGQSVRLGGVVWIVTDSADPAAIQLLAKNTVAAMPYGASNNLWNTSLVKEYLNGEFLSRLSGEEQALVVTTRLDTYIKGGTAPTETGNYQAGIPSLREMEAIQAAVGAEAVKCDANYWVRTRVPGQNGKGILELYDGSGHMTLNVDTQGSRWCDAGVRPLMRVNLSGALLSGDGTEASPYTLTKDENGAVRVEAQAGEPVYRLTVTTGAELFGTRATDNYKKEQYDLLVCLVGEKGRTGWFAINPFLPDSTLISGTGGYAAPAGRGTAAAVEGKKPGAGTETAFLIDTADVGHVNQIICKARGKSGTADWYITRIVAEQFSGGKTASGEAFEAHQWVMNPSETTLDAGVEYTVTVKTGNVPLAGTDSNIYIRLIGESGAMTDEVKLNPLIEGNAFEKGSTDVVTASFSRNVGRVNEIQLRSDMKWAGADWYVDWIKVKNLMGTETTFQVGEWIADTNTRIFTTSPGKSTQYKLTVTTGDEQGAGTDSNIYVKLVGSSGETGEREISELYAGNAFEKGTEQTLIVNFDKSVGTLKQIRIRSDMKWAGADWQLAKIKAEPIVNGEIMPGVEFAAGEWINDTAWRTYGSDPADSVQYRLAVKTGDTAAAGTDSNIYVKLVGSKGETEEREISELVNGNAFERGNTDTVNVSFDKNIGEVRQIKVRSDMKWAGAQWLIESIQADPIYNGQIQEGGKTFQIREWITDTGWHTFSVDANAITQYRFTVRTGKLSWFPKGEGTDSMIYVKLVGDKGITNEMEISELVSGNAFERDSTDTLNVTFENAVGNLKAIQVRSDMKWAGADWYLEFIEVQPMLNGTAIGNSKRFSYNGWIDDTVTRTIY